MGADPRVPEMEFGSLFDSFITKGKQTLNDYAVADFSVPPAEKGVLDYLATTSTISHFDEVEIQDVLNAAETVGYQSKWKPQTRYEKISNYSEYYDTLKSGKKLVSKADWDDAMEMYKVFREDPYLKKLFGTKNTDEIEYIYQAQFKTTFNTGFEAIDVKIMPDLMVVNHKEKTIRLVDLKTSSMPAYDFPEHFVKMRYDIQGELYTDVMKKIIADDEDYCSYTILPYLFVDISRADMVPVTYEIDLSDGFSFTKGDKVYQYKGWKQLLVEILAYEANDAKVPEYITTASSNDLVEILGR